MEIINFIGMPISIISSGPRKDDGVDDEDIMLIILSHIMVKKLLYKL